MSAGKVPAVKSTTYLYSTTIILITTYLRTYNLRTAKNKP